MVRDRRVAVVADDPDGERLAAARALGVVGKALYRAVDHAHRVEHLGGVGAEGVRGLVDAGQREEGDGGALARDACGEAVSHGALEGQPSREVAAEMVPGEPEPGCGAAVEAAMARQAARERGEGGDCVGLGLEEGAAARVEVAVGEERVDPHVTARAARRAHVPAAAVPPANPGNARVARMPPREERQVRRTGDRGEDGRDGVGAPGGAEACEGGEVARVDRRREGVGSRPVRHEEDERHVWAPGSLHRMAQAKLRWR